MVNVINHMEIVGIYQNYRHIYQLGDKPNEYRSFLLAKINEDFTSID
jgi:hypothetical protein